MDAAGECSGPCKVSLEAHLGGTDTLEREMQDRQAHEKRIGWTVPRSLGFSRLYEANIGTWTWTWAEIDAIESMSDLSLLSAWEPSVVPAISRDPSWEDDDFSLCSVVSIALDVSFSD